MQLYWRGLLRFCFLWVCSTFLGLSGQQAELDRFGGWKGKQFEASGYFRLEQGDDRWWLVSPDGNAFLIHGMDHCGAYVTGHDYNKEH